MATAGFSRLPGHQPLGAKLGKYSHSFLLFLTWLQVSLFSEPVDKLERGSRSAGIKESKC